MREQGQLEQGEAFRKETQELAAALRLARTVYEGGGEGVLPASLVPALRSCCEEAIK